MSPRHPEVAEPQPNRSMQDLECYPAFGSSGSIHLSSKGKSLREKQTLIDSGSESGMTKIYKVQGDKILKNLFTYSLTHLLTSKKAAFTLAEVLITLVIIGVVAAMTIPTLISDYQEKVTITKVATAYSILSNAWQMSLVESGSFKIKTWII